MLDRRNVGITLACVIAVGVLGWLDAISGPELGFSVFYIAPVAAAGWKVGRTAALLVAVLSAVAWFAATGVWHTGGQTMLHTGWNATQRFAIFAALGWLSAGLQSERKRLITVNTQLQETLEREAAAARNDALTGLFNFQGIHEQLNRELARSERTGEPFSVAFVDLDDFKMINDQHGHAAGDEVLQQVGAALRGAVRTMDIPGRLGGDEFLVLLPGTDAEAARAIGERIRSSIVEVGRRHPGSTLDASIGVVCPRRNPPSGVDLVQRADAAMYEAKRAGKGRVAVVELDGPDPAASEPVVSAGER